MPTSHRPSCCRVGRCELAVRLADCGGGGCQVEGRRGVGGVGSHQVPVARFTHVHSARQSRRRDGPRCLRVPSHQQGRRPLVQSQTHHHRSTPAPFTLDNYFDILFRNQNFEISLLKVSTFTLEIGLLSKANIVDASFDVCKHWPSDQSQRSVSEISSAKFRKIQHVLNSKLNFEIYFFRKLTAHTRNFLAKGTNLHKF